MNDKTCLNCRFGETDGRRHPCRMCSGPGSTTLYNRWLPLVPTPEGFPSWKACAESYKADYMRLLAEKQAELLSLSTQPQLNWEQVAAMAKECCTNVMDHDLTGKPITEADVLMMSAFGPLVVRLVNHVRGPLAPQPAQAVPACWACGGTRKVTTSSNGSGPFEAVCQACDGDDLVPARVAEIDARIVKKITEFGSADSSNLDPELLAEAKKTIDALAPIKVAASAKDLGFTEYLTENELHSEQDAIAFMEEWMSFPDADLAHGVGVVWRAAYTVNKGRPLRSTLQQMCYDQGTYWRAADAHGVNLTVTQATELLREALDVEVEINTAEGEGT